VDERAVVDVSERLLALGVDELSISDTVGMAAPVDVRRVLAALGSAGIGADRLALHLHDTRGTALANVYAGLQCGITTYDSSAGGLGGCPYAPGASGNLATEDLLYLLDGLGIQTGVTLSRVVEASRFLAGKLGHRPPGRYLAAVSGQPS
jgi:hydroxymethylglutaryl-CoA lyase